MSVSKLWTDYSVQVGSNYVDGITSASVNQQLSTMVEAADGNVFATFGSLVKGAPAARFSTLDVAAGITRAGTQSVAIGSNPASVILFFRSRAAGGSNAAGNAGTHVSCTIAAGMLVPRRISARSGGNASMDVEVFGSNSSGTDPFAYSNSANLPGNTPGVAQVWTIGKVVLNSTVLDGLESIDVDFGVGVGIEARDSDVFPSFVYVTGQRPTIRVKGVHIDQLAGAAITADGFYYTAAQVVFYFRARAEGGTFVADGTASHIKFTLGKCRVDPIGIEGDPKNVDLLITPWLDTGGPTNPIAVNTASAIS